jgi:hypothetical protein
MEIATMKLRVILLAFSLLAFGAIPAAAQYRGDIDLGDTFDCKFTTTDTSGVPATLGGTPAVSAYVDNGTTEITAGITTSADFDGRVGLNNIRVVATSGNGYTTGTNVDLVITTGTVGGASVVGYVPCSFSIDKRSGLRPATAGRTLVVDAAGLADANTVKLGPSGSGTTQTARDIGASVLLSTGTGTGQLDFTSGIVKSNVTQIDGSATNGNNATLKLAGLSIVAAAGADAVTITGGAASGATPAGAGINATGGAASTTGGGVSAAAIKATGGAGAASTNGAATAITATGGGTITVSGGRGVLFQGTGARAGLDVTAGDTATVGALAINGGATSGPGLRIVTTSGNGVTISPNVGHGMAITADGVGNDAINLAGATDGSGLDILGSRSGAGIKITGGSASGAAPGAAAIDATGGAASTTGGGISAAAIKATGGAGAASTNGASAGMTSDGGGTTTVTGGAGAVFTATGNLDGVQYAGAGSGAGYKATGGATGIGGNFVGGATSGTAIKAYATAGNSVGVDIASRGSQTALGISALGTGIGMWIHGGATSGVGVKIDTTSGDAVQLAPTIGNAIQATSDGAGNYVIDLTAGSNSGGLKITPQGTGHGIFVDSNGTGDGVRIAGGNVSGDAIHLVTTSGDGLDASTDVAGGVPIRGSVTGNLTGSIGSVSAGGIAASSFAASAIDATAIADNAIDAAALATDTITAAKIAADSIGASEIADNAIDAGAIATDAITAAKIAASAITSSEFAQSAADEVWSTATRALTDKIDFTLAATGADPTVPSGVVVTDAGNSTSQAKTDLTGGNNNRYKDALIRFTGTCNVDDEVKKILTSDATTGIITWTPVVTATPDDGCGVLIINR